MIVGLGNPGRTYRLTRHNLGFWLIEQLAKRHEIVLSRRGMQSVYGRGKIGSTPVILAKPLTYMNLSGEAVSRLLRFFKILPENLIILHDDLDLPPGKIRIRRRGGYGGHQGVKSVIDAVGDDGFIRVKVGIGRPLYPNQDPADFVLEPLTEAVKDQFLTAVERATQAVEVLMAEGLQEAMNRFHGNQEE